MIISHEHPEFQRIWNKQTPQRIKNKWNGGYFYSKEIVERIIPNVKTDRNWVTVNLMEAQIGCDHAIVFVHNHTHCPEWYEWYAKYEDLIFVCSTHKDVEKLKHIGKSVYLPLSVDVEYVKQFRTEKTKDVAFCGRKAKERNIPPSVDRISNIPREQFLAEMAKYRKVYAVDRCAVEARVLGCEVLYYDDRCIDTWEILDNLDASKMLQKIIDEVDHV